MGERRGTKALETWCRRVTQGYPGVKVENMTTSWRDGLAFCALIHHFRPDLIDFSRLDKSDVYGNNELAFRIAERHLGIPALLDAEDMAEYPVPDRLSILTYLSQFYQAFASNSSSPVKKAATDSPDGSLASLVQGNVQPPPKMEWSAKVREPCAICKLPVFIAQKLRVEGRLYHRTCFRCGRCDAQLNPADCYETCTGIFVCETCPDEMEAPEKTDNPLPDNQLESPTSPSPAVPPSPATPPEPPPSIVAIRRLMFDTDDAKLMQHDQSVNTTRLAHSIKKDLSTNIDSRSFIDKDEANSVNINVDMTEDFPMNPEAEISVKNSKKLDKSVNNSTIPASSITPESESEHDSNTIETSPCPIVEDSSVNLVDNSSVKEPLDVRPDTLSSNDSFKDVSTDKPMSNSDSDIIVHSNKNVADATENDYVVDKKGNVATETLDSRAKSTLNESIQINVLVESNEKVETNPVVENCHVVENEYYPTAEEKAKVKRMESVEYPTDLNPFSDSDEEDDVKKVDPLKKVSTNPFGSDSEEDEEPPVKPPPRATPRKMSISMRSTTSTNPFESDEDEDIESVPVAQPRKSLQSSPEPTPFPRRSKLRTSARSITSLSSIGSYSSTSPRKKRPAPPPPPSQTPTLSPSSRYSSVSSLNRPRKNKRAPPPPTAQTSSKTNDISQEASMVSVENISIPEIEVTQPPETVLENASATGELAAQIEAGMQKLIDQNNSLSRSDLTQITDERKPQEIVPLQSEQINEELSALSLTTKVEKDSINQSSKTSSIITGNTLGYDDDSSPDIKDHANEIQNIESMPEDESPKVDINNEDVSLDGKLSCDRSTEDIDNNEKVSSKKTEQIAETFNEVLLSNSKSSTEFVFGEIERPAHSTPIKVIPALSMFDSSLEDVESGNSLPEAPHLASPSASCADTSSYQDSLASPPTEKRQKDSANMHRKISDSGTYQPHKSTYGQWKRKKAPPPPLPVQRRPIQPMAIQKIRQELSDIEIKQQELERQGVSLEQKIREKFDSDTSITPFLEDLVLQLFELVNEKNDLFRRQAELMYLRRQHQLEEEHAELEFQIRCLMARPEANKTDSDKELEEKLIQRLVEVVERRDAIIQCLEMDRLREVEEDKSINKQLDRFTQAIVTDDKKKKKHKKKKEKTNSLKTFELYREYDDSEKEGKKKKKWYTLHHKMTKHS